jgi:hypothetical protein
MLWSMNSAMAARPTTRPHAGSTKTASSVKNSASADHVAVPASMSSRRAT